MSNEMTKAESGQRAAVVESIVLRGDISGLGPRERAAYYITMCERLGLDPYTKPFEFLKLNGKEVMYANKGCADQLARIHNVTRRIVDGPKVIDLAGTKLVYCVCEASMPNGRVETSTATVPLADPSMVLMKCETKAKRRATLSILALAMLDEMEVESIPADRRAPGGDVDLARVAEPSLDEPAGEVPHPLDLFLRDVAAIKLPGEAVAVWTKHRGALAVMERGAQDAAWKAIYERVGLVGQMKSPKVWLKKALAEEYAKTTAAAPVERAREPGDDDNHPDPPAGGTTSSKGPRTSSANGGAVTAPTAGAQALASLPEWMLSRDGVRSYLAAKGSYTEVERAVRKWGRHSSALCELAGERLDALAPTTDTGYRTPLALHQRDVATWRDEGPARDAADRRAVAAMRRAS